jgi:SWI/SNF-related matrix-associated actin-dependent regulator 1 of chromatin subfamily A
VPEFLAHQPPAIEWLTEHTRNGYFDDQGLGKTICAITAAVQLGVKRVLIVAPSVVAHNWARELRIWAPGMHHQVVTSGSAKLSSPVIITTHGLLLADKLYAQLIAREWDLLIIDESQFFRNPKAKRTKRLYGDLFRKDKPSLTRASARVWALTGTPMVNNPSELWTMLAGIAPSRVAKTPGGLPMNWHQWRARFCVLAPSPYGDGVKVVGSKNTVELKARLKGFALRRMKKDVLTLPPVRYGTVTLTSGALPKALRDYEAGLRRPPQTFRDATLDETMGHGRVVMENLSNELKEELSGGPRNGISFSTWRRLCGEAKVEPTVELLKMELDGGTDKIVVGAHHTSVIDGIAAGLVDYKPIVISGATPPAKRTELVRRFQADPTIRVAVVNILAGGVGITLTAASECVLVEQSFAPGDNAQFIDRIVRIGQTRPVQVRTLALADSVDEIVTEILSRKTQMIQEVMK